MDLNLIRIIFLLNAVTVTLLGIVITVAEPCLPVPIVNLFRNGRFAAKGKSALPIPTIEVPKRWFKHFYNFAAPSATYILFIALLHYLRIAAVPNHIYELLDVLLGANRKPLVSPEHTVLALILITIQCWKRFYETHYVNVFSNGKINLGHYILGFLHYVGTLACLIGESEGFVRGSVPKLNRNGLTYADYVSAVVFLWASYKQLCSNVILANLRKNKKGEVVTLHHKVPNGGLFDYISSPLQSTEILMYFMLTFVLWNSFTYHYIFFWVLMNQIGTGLFGHWWYVETFKDYPKQRRALIPYLL